MAMAHVPKTARLADIAQRIEHTVLKPDSTKSDIEKVCNEALEHGFGGVCIAPTWLEVADTHLKGSPVRIVTVAGFPHGNTTPQAKAAEAERSIAAGAQDIDMVIQIGHLRSGDHAYVRDDIRGVVEVARSYSNVRVKVILETGFLTTDEIERACDLAEQAGADFVKTSTGFGPLGATVESIEIMSRSVGGRLGIKAAGGISDGVTALAIIEAGADLLGCSRSINIIRELSERNMIEKTRLAKG